VEESHTGRYLRSRVGDSGQAAKAAGKKGGKARAK